MSAVAVSEPRAEAPASSAWLFSMPVDLSVFLGSALVSLALLWIGARAGLLGDSTPEWAWVPCVLLIDVAHVYSTSFKVYLDTTEIRRRPLLYAAVPIVGLAVSIALYSMGSLVFWRALAYLAVFHFIRQQYGWVALYRGRLGEHDRLGHWLDAATVYAATLYPLAYWHANLPRRFWWFLEDDFWLALPSAAATAIGWIYVALLATYVARSARAWFVTRRPNPGKDIVVVTTAVCWYAGIVAYNSDYAFTVTNVIVHGVPYLALVWFSAARRTPAVPGSMFARFFGRGALVFLATLWALAYVEELVWDRAVWQDRAWLFGEGWDVAGWHFLIVPLLAVPQIVHYILDGFIWKRRERAEA
jgi:hypothetical protein